MTTPAEKSIESSTEKRRIFLVDDHALVRDCLTDVVNREPDLMVCGEAETTAEARTAILGQQPDAVVVDLSLKDSSGIELIKELKRYCPKVAVIVLSMHEESHYAERAFLAGARGYVMKRETTRNVIAAIRQVINGKLFLSEGVAFNLIERLVGDRGAEPRPAVETLSDREMQVFELVGKGWNTRDIGQALGVTVKTIQAHYVRIKGKLHLQSATELLRQAVRFHDAEK